MQFLIIPDIIEAISLLPLEPVNLT